MCAVCQKLETFRVMKHHLEDLMAGKTNVMLDDHSNFKTMIQSPIIEWNKEATAAIEHGTNLLMDSFRLTDKAIQMSTNSVKSDIENDKKTKKVK
ncbi:hypothetical protein QTP88_013958 [Uroleucon formosanum]